MENNPELGSLSEEIRKADFNGPNGTLGAFVAALDILEVSIKYNAGEMRKVAETLKDARIRAENAADRMENACKAISAAIRTESITFFKPTGE